MTIDPQLAKALAVHVNSCQESTASHAKLLTKCQQIYKQSNSDDFFDAFSTILQNVLITMVKNPNVDRMIEFIAKFAVSLSASTTQNGNQDEKTTATAVNNNENDNEEQTLAADNTSAAIGTSQTTTDEIENAFLVSLLNYLLSNHRANSDAVRYRCCQILAKLMGCINSEQFIDEELFDKLCDAMLERLKDINSRVQVQAIAAIHRLQDPNDRNCRVIKALLFLMTHDPHWQVRFQALSHIAFSKQTLPNIIDRVRDMNPTVRRKALLILSEKVLIKFISIDKRIFILNYSLKDDDPLVLETCCKKLLPSWLAFKENNIVKLLKALDVVEATETVELMLNKMYADDSLETLCKDFTLLNDKHIIELENLDPESVTYWKWLCEKCKQCDDDNNLDLILPSLTEFCDYIRRVFDKFNAAINETTDVRKRSENFFVVKQLVKMFSCLDFVDIHGKKAVTSLCHDLFSNRDYAYLFETIMGTYKLAVPKLEQRINNLTELISDLKDSGMNDNDEELVITEANRATLSSGPHDGHLGSSTPRVTGRELSLKITELKFKRFKLKEEFDSIYKEALNINKTIDMKRIADLREELKRIEDELAELQTEATPVEDIQLTPAVLNETAEEAAQRQKKPNNQNLDSSMELDSIYHCLQLSVCLLEDIELKTLTPQLRALCDTLILPSVGSVNEEIRTMAVRALNLICILKLDIAQKYVPLFLEMIQHDKKDIVIEAFKAMINSIMAYSLNKLVSHLDDTEQAKIEATTKIISIITSLLDHDDSEMYTNAVEGFCKLFMTGHIISAKLFSKLLIMYYSPLTQNDKKLRSVLACFLPQFAFLRSTNQICVEESFMITVKSLMNASPDSYLSEIDLMKVTETLLHLTNPKNVLRKANQRQFIINNTCHENIGKAICFEVLHEDNAFKFRTFIKILNTIDLSLADYDSLKELKKLSVEVADHISDRLLKKSAQKFTETIDALLLKKPEYERDRQQNRLSNGVAVNETKNSNGDDTLTNTLNSSDLIDIEFKKINKKPNDKKHSSTINETTTSVANKTTNDLSKSVKNCSVILKRAAVAEKPTKSKKAALEKTTDEMIIPEPREARSRRSATATNDKPTASKKAAAAALDDSSSSDEVTIIETRDTRGRKSVVTSANTSRRSESKKKSTASKPVDLNDTTSSDEVTFIETRESRSRVNSGNTSKHDTNASLTPSSLASRRSARLSNTPTTNRQKTPTTVLKKSQQQAQNKRHQTSDSKLNRTQSESPCTSVEYEPPSKVRKSNRIQSANTRSTRRK